MSEVLDMNRKIPKHHCQDAPAQRSQSPVLDASLKDSLFQIPTRQYPIRLNDIGEEAEANHSFPTKETIIEIKDNASTSSWEEISTPLGAEDAPIAPSFHDTNDAEEESPQQTRRFTKAQYSFFFFKCIQQGDIKKVRAHLATGLDLEREGKGGYSPLIMAIMEGQVTITRLLLEKGANVHHRGGTLPPIVHAVMKKERAPQLIQLLLDHGADLNITSGKAKMNPLHWAAYENMIDAADFLLSRGMDVNVACDQGQTSVILAAERGHLSLVKLLLAQEADLFLRARNGAVALQWAACNGHLDVVKLLLAEGVEVDDLDACGLTAMSTASHFGHPEVVEYLIEQGAELDLRSTQPKDVTAAMAAAMQNHAEVLQILIDHGADLTIPNGSEETILDTAMLGGQDDCVKILLRAIGGPEYPLETVALQMAMARTRATLTSLISTVSIMYSCFETRDPGEFAWLGWVLETGGELVRPKVLYNLMHTALHENKVDMLKALIGYGCDVNKQLASGHTPLSVSVLFRDIEVVRILLDAGADPNIPCRDPKREDMTPLHQAIVALDDDLEKDTSVVDLLLASGKCNILAGRDLFSTPFAYVVRKIDQWKDGVAEVLLFRMLESVKDINTERSKGGFALLHVAVHHGRKDLIDICLGRGADINAPDDLGGTPFLQQCSHSPDLLSFLLVRGANIHEKDKQGHTALHFAAMHGQIKVIEFLLHKGLDIEAKAHNGATPLRCALNHRQEDAIILLKEEGAITDVFKDISGGNILHSAIGMCMEKLVDQLLKDGDYNVNLPTSRGWLPLTLAAGKGSPKLIDLLLAAGADPEAPQETNDRPLHVALISGNQPAAIKLIEYGVNVSEPGSLNCTPLHLAVEHRAYTAAKLIINLTSTTDALDEDLATPLCLNSDPVIAQLLVGNGANVGHADRYGWTPLHHAVACKSVETFRVLCKAGARLDVRTKNDGITVAERICWLKEDGMRERFWDVIEEELGEASLDSVEWDMVEEEMEARRKNKLEVGK